MSRLKRLIVEVHQRSLWQVFLVYLGAAWACFELIDAVTARLGLPAWLPGLAIVLFLLGLPFVVATACIREEPLSAGVEERPGEVAKPAGISRGTTAARRRFLTWRNALASLVVALAVWGVVAAGLLMFGARAGSPAERKMLVVLPFENLGAPEDAYFADGVTEEITSRLVSVHSIGVIGRTSAVQYRNTDKAIEVIGEELGVDYILEGTVRWQKLLDGTSRVRITPQLIRVSDATHVWAERYDFVLEDIFQIQTDIARQVTAALGVSLAGSERRSLEALHTQNLDAYDFYLRGREYLGRSQYLTAAELYSRAIELDSTFALAYSELSRAHSNHYRASERTEERIGKSKQAVDRAFELDRDLPEAYAALGGYYYALRDYERALAGYSAAHERRPNDADFLRRMALAQRRMGRFEEAVASLERSIELDPRNLATIQNLCSSYIKLRKYAEAEPWLDRYIALVPDRGWPYWWKAVGLVTSEGKPDEAHEVLELWTNRPGVRDAVSYYFARPSYFQAQSMFRVLREYYTNPALTLQLTRQTVDSTGYFMLKAAAFRLSGEWQLSRAYYDSARVIWEESVERRPVAILPRAVLGLIYAGLGRREDAIREGEAQLQLVSQDALAGPEAVAYLAEIYTMVDEHDRAIDQLEYLLTIPTEVGVPLLRLDPLYDPLRDHPRFQALLAEYEVTP